MNKNQNKPPKGAEFLLKIFLTEEDYLERLGDYEEGYLIKTEEKGKLRASLWYWFQVILGIPVFIKNTLYWGGSMYKHYLKIAFRNFAKQKLFSLINVLGLAVGLAACLIIFFWVQDELSYDDFNKNAKRIYRLERDTNYDNQHVQVPITSFPYGPTMVNDYPEVVNSLHMVKDEISIRDSRNIFTKQEVLGAENSIFDLFSFELIRGDKNHALDNPRSLILDEEKAVKYFGTLDCVGKTLSVQEGAEVFDYMVTGVMAKVPHNSHLHFEAILSFATYPEERKVTWSGNWLYTYLLLDEHSNIENLESKFPEFITKYCAPEIAPFLPPGTDVNSILKLRLKPLESIHLYPTEVFEIEDQGNITYVYVFSAISILILLIACINFMNLSTARASKRAKEVGLRKAVGAYKQSLWKQFLSESTVTAFAALIVAVIIIILTLPGFNTLSGKEIPSSILLNSNIIFYLLTLTIITGAIAGLYPAFVLSAYQPAKVLKNEVKSGSRSIFRKVTTVMQFVISIALIICTLAVNKQMQFFKNKALGFDKENVVVIEAVGNEIAPNYNKFRNELHSSPQIISVSSSMNYPGNSRFSDTMFERTDSEEKTGMNFMSADDEYLQTYGITLVSGRNFTKVNTTDLNGAVIVNESALKKLNLNKETVLGKILRPVGIPIGDLQIVGVAKDFHFRSLHQEIQPFALIFSDQYSNFVSVRITPGNAETIIKSIETVWDNNYPNKTFNFSFLDERINSLYESEQRMGRIILVFSLFSIMVACLGLFGLASFTAEEKTKEIGIRKVLGSSISEIILLLSKQFIKWILIANILAWPIAYFTMDYWLENFAYKAELGYGIFLLSTVLTLSIALITVSYQAIKAATANPVTSLKHE